MKINRCYRNIITVYIHVYNHVRVYNYYRTFYDFKLICINTILKTVYKKQNFKPFRKHLLAMVDLLKNFVIYRVSINYLPHFNEK